MKHENAAIRGRGDIGGPDLPMKDDQNHEVDMANSLPETNVSDLKTGFCPYGPITDGGSDPAAMKPGMNNKGSSIKSSGGY